MLRPLLKQILVLLTRRSLDKHGTELIVVTGNGQTSVAREAIYTVLKTKYAARRNIEIPETEFSIPLLILGAKLYPRSTFEWIQTIIKTALQLMLVKSHKHFLILEISDVKKEIAEFWMKIVQPSALVICDKTTLSPLGSQITKEFHLKDGNLDAHFKTAKQIGEQFGISEKEVEKALKNFEMPPQRIRILVGEKGQIIIDSTYHYSPPPLGSILEIADKFKGEKILITDYPKDKETWNRRQELLSLKNKNLVSCLLSLNPDVIILRGRKGETRELLEELTGRLQP